VALISFETNRKRDDAAANRPNAVSRKSRLQDGHRKVDQLNSDETQSHIGQMLKIQHRARR